jgi:hypothetical protein
MAEAATLERIQIYGGQELLDEVPALVPGFDATGQFEYLQPDVALPTPDHVRPPEAEIYGRSLSTIYKLGVFVVGKVASEVVYSPEAEQARAEFYTSVEEGFGTDIELGGHFVVRDFDARPVLGGRVMAKDFKTAVSGMTEAGLICAEEKVRKETSRNDDRFVPQLIRSRWDHKNALECDAMVRGETDYNTRIIISPFPEEAAARSGDEYWRDIGYVPHLKRGFVQLYHAGMEGFVSGSLSFDGSNKEKLREILGRHNTDIPEDEVTDNYLHYAITTTLSEEEAKALALEIADQAGDPDYKKTTNTVDITSEHHKIMDAVFNESYIHACESLARGHQTPGVRELIFQMANNGGSFNDRYAAALYRMRSDGSTFTDDDMVVLHELLVYSTIEMMRAIHIAPHDPDDGGARSFNGNRGSGVTHLGHLDQVSFQSMLASYGAEGARNNRIYSACGLSISLGGAADSQEKPQYAFGGREDNGDSTLGDEDKFGSLEFDCPKCKSINRRPRNQLISHCQKCKADVTCG